MNGDLTAMKTLYTLYKEGKIAYFKNKSLAYLQEMAFYYLEMMAKAKDPMALKICAKTFYEGNQVTRRNYEKACSYYQTLHDMGDIEGKYGYGVCLLYGQGTKQNIELAKTLFEQCSQDKHPQALGKLGDIYRMGMKTAVDAEKAKKYYMEASRLQDLESLLNLGLLNYREQIENHSPALAYSYMETAAKKGYFQAMYWLGIFHDIGVGCTASFKEAEKWFEKAIKAGSVGSKYKYGAMILDKIEHQKINSKKKIAYYQRARKLMIEYCLDPQHSQSNHAYAMHYLGMIYKQGLGIEVSDRTARYWFEMAATTGLSKSMVEVHLYLKGKEPIPSLKWLKDALKDTQCSEALYEMGNLYLEGYGSLIESDIKQAKFYYEQAARLNHPQALEKLMMN